jgi:hypothetical protein
MNIEPESKEQFQKKLDCAIGQICHNISALSPENLEEMVREKLIDPKAIPPDLRTKNVKLDWA